MDLASSLFWLVFSLIATLAAIQFWTLVFSAVLAAVRISNGDKAINQSARQTFGYGLLLITGVSTLLAARQIAPLLDLVDDPYLREFEDALFTSLVLMVVMAMLTLAAYELIMPRMSECEDVAKESR